MPDRVATQYIEEIKDRAFSLVSQYSRRLRHLRHCDVRLEVSEGVGAVAENGQEKASTEDYGFSIGVRVIAGKGIAAPGYFGQTLGASDTEDLDNIIVNGIRHAYDRAMASAERKALARGRFGPLGESLADMALAPVDIRQDTVGPTFRVDPRTFPLDKIVRQTAEVSRAIAGVSSQVVFNVVGTSTMLVRELFCSTEGAFVDQSYAQTEGFVMVVAAGQHGPLELYDFTGHQRGWEVMDEGFHDGPIQLPDLMSFSLGLARTTVEVANAPPVPATDHDVVVVIDPHFATLVAHEVVGHPSELDRALKFETAYAGRSWLFKSMEDNQIGKQVASPLVTAFSDPTMDGYGHYIYDHEGTPARRVYHIQNGIYREFLNSRQTAAILGVQPNGSNRATDASLVPLIRMSNTVFSGGDRDPRDIIREVERGYYLAGHRIPSVAESRENFRISAMKVYEIRNGELGQLYRDGGISADTRDFFMRVDAVGNDFRMFPIPNCGKGQPMQAKRMSNGGPTMRSVARVTGSRRG